jgi:hypothetical protein
MVGTFITMFIIFRLSCASKRTGHKTNSEKTRQTDTDKPGDLKHDIHNYDPKTSDTDNNENFLIVTKGKLASTSSFVKNKKLKPPMARIDYNAEELVSETEGYAPEDLRVPSNLPDMDNLRQAFQAKNRGMFSAVSTYADGAVPNPLYANTELVTSVYMTKDSANFMAHATSAQRSQIIDNVHEQASSRVTLRATSAIRSQTFEQGVSRSMNSLHSIPNYDREATDSPSGDQETDSDKKKY